VRRRSEVAGSYQIRGSCDRLVRARHVFADSAPVRASCPGQASEQPVVQAFELRRHIQTRFLEAEQ
jgi:hypothetical protein